jgi:hypothetical protein
VLDGGAGNDLIIGGPGNDSFVFRKDFGHDTILDFQAAGAAHDSITFSKSVFADWTALAGAEGIPVVPISLIPARTHLSHPSFSASTCAFSSPFAPTCRSRNDQASSHL